MGPSCQEPLNTTQRETAACHKRLQVAPTETEIKPHRQISFCRNRIILKFHHCAERLINVYFYFGRR